MTSIWLNRLVCTVQRTLEHRQFDDLSDAELLNRIRSGAEASAFEAIVRRHASLVLSAARRVLCDSADVDDVFQATFLVLLQETGRIRKRQSLGSWG